MPVIQQINKYSDLELALMALLGYLGNGEARKNKLGSRYNTVQGIVNQILAGTVPAGSGIDPERIRRAVLNVFTEVISETAEEIVNEAK